VSGQRRRAIAGLTAAMLLAGCAVHAHRTPPPPDPAHAAMLVQIDKFLPKAQAETAQCRYQPDRRLLDTYLDGLRTLRMSPAGGAELAAETIVWFEQTFRHCRQQMGF
jgi:hypothetical protein